MDTKSFWIAQRKQQQLWHDWSALTDTDRSNLSQELLLGLNEETAELQRLVQRAKYHILKPRQAITREDVAEAGIDVFKYLIALMQLNGVTAEDFETAYSNKTAVVEDRWVTENMDLKGAKVFMCDLDECVAEWLKGFNSFLKLNKVDKELDPDVNHPDKEYWKNSFDMSGGYKNLLVKPGAQIALAAIKASGIKLVIVTARPYHRHRRIYSDTLEWLAVNQIQHDSIMFTRDKADAVTQLLPAQVIGFAEDRMKHAVEVAMAGIQVYKLPGPANEPFVQHVNIKHVTDWVSIAHSVLGSHAEELYEAALQKAQLQAGVEHVR